MLWVLKRTISKRQFEYPKQMLKIKANPGSEFVVAYTSVKLVKWRKFGANELDFSEKV